MKETPPLILFSKSKYMYASEISSSSTFIVLSIEFQLKAAALK